MEARSENLDLQLRVVEGQASNRQVLVANEELALTSESVFVGPDFIEVEKKTVVTTSAIEKLIIHKSTGNTIPVDQGEQTLSINASYVDSESCFHDNQEPSPMEIASQGSSLESGMEIFSEGSLMDYSSLESNTTTEPVVSSTEATCNAKLAKEEKSLVHPDLPYVEDEFIAEISSTSDKPPVSENNFHLGKENDLEKEFVKGVPVAEKSFKENMGSSENLRIFQEYGDEKYLETEFVKSSVEKENCRTDENEVPSIFQQYGREKDLKEFVKEEKSIPKLSLKRRSSMENRLLLAREESVTAREESCDAREIALKKQEAAIANQKEILKQYYDDNIIPSPKRLKTKKTSL